MLEIFKKIRSQESGFTLTEVLIGMMILSVAIVSGTNLLITLMDANRSSADRIQAYYFAAEGLELVREVRDTNWLHNRDWLGAGAENIWESSLKPDSSYSVNLKSEGWKNPPRPTEPNEDYISLFRNSAPVALREIFNNPNEGIIYRYSNGDQVFFSTEKRLQGKATKYKRVVDILPYPDCGEDNCDRYVKVSSRVSWMEGAEESSFTLEAVLTDWKGGAL